MKTSDEQLNEALRTAFGHKFEHFEAEPEAGAFTKIREQLPARKNWKYLFFTLAFVFFGVTGILVDQKVNYSNSVKTALKSGTEKVLVVNQNRGEISYLVPNLISDLPESLSFTITKKKQRFAAKRTTRSKTPQVENVMHSAQNSEANAVSTTLSAPDFLESKSTRFDTLTLPEVEKGFVPVVAYENALTSSKWKILVNVAALEGYQILTVPASAASHYQHFKLPRALSLQSVGYKLSAGVEKRGMQIRISYSSLRQRYSYEVAGNEYFVEESGPESYRIVRPGERVEVEQKTDLLGLGISRQWQWGRPAVSRYYAAAGLEYARSVRSNQQLSFVNLSVGKRFLVSKNVLAEIGPFAELSPFKIKTEQNPFVSQPYRVGVRVGVAFAP